MPEFRDPILDQLHQKIRQSDGAPIYLVGPPGSGKSYLIDTYLKRTSDTYDTRFWFGREVAGRGASLITTLLLRLEAYDGGEASYYPPASTSRRRAAHTARVNRRRIVLGFDEVATPVLEQLRLQDIDPLRREFFISAAARSRNAIGAVPTWRTIAVPPNSVRRSENSFTTAASAGRETHYTSAELRDSPFRNLDAILAGRSSTSVPVDLAIRHDGDRFVVAAVFADEPHLLLGTDNKLAGTLPYLVVRRLSHAYSLQLTEFESLLNDSRTPEEGFQKFFERHPHFLMGYDYLRLVPQVVLPRSDNKSLRPDFMLQPFASRYADLLELKLPSETLVVGSRDRKHFAATVSSAVAQVREYRDYFENDRNRELVMEKYGLTAFRPHATLVIGRTPSDLDEEKLRQLHTDLPSYLRILTYDDLYARMTRMAELIEA